MSRKRSNTFSLTVVICFRSVGDQSSVVGRCQGGGEQEESDQSQGPRGRINGVGYNGSDASYRTGPSITSITNGEQRRGKEKILCVCIYVCM